MSAQRTPLGWPVLPPDSTLLHTWVIPGVHRRFQLRNGSIGFILAHTLLYWHERVESLNAGHPADDWGYAYRPVTGGRDWSEHAAGSAADANATQHPYGVGGTFTRKQLDTMHARLRWMTRLAGGNTAVRWGEDYRKPDGMHLEVVCGGNMRVAEKVAKRLANTPRGRRILKANPGQRAVIWS